MHADSDHLSALTPFIEEGWITEILYEVKSGKEATVYCCVGGTRADVPLIAAKVFRPIETRSFRNDARYVGGRMHMARNGRAKRAVDGKSAFGRKVQYHTWIDQEWKIMNTLHTAGVAVPKPFVTGERAILMSFLGDAHGGGGGGGPAPMLHALRPDRDETARIIDALLDDIELMLDCQCVHGDLSPHNVMVHDGQPIIIDFPQAVDPRLNHDAAALLARDIENICKWASKHGVHRPASRIMTDLWSRFVMGELG